MSDSDQPKLKGALLAVMPLRVRGWAFAPTRPGEHVMVEVRVDDTLVASVEASAHFPDLERKGIGRGDHGFVANFTQEIPVEEQKRITVLAVAGNGDRLVLQRALPPAVPPPQAPSGIQMSRFSPVDHSQHPVFVLGSARSGTSAMAQALKNATRYAGHGEGHFLDLFPKLLQTVNAHYNRRKRERVAPDIMIAHVPPELVIEGVQNVFVEIVRGLFPVGYWMDKTPGPEMIRAVPSLSRIWPGARYIFMKRRPIENIESRRRKFPNIGFTEHCTLWAESMSSWETVRDGLKDVSLEIDQMRLALQPEAVAEEVTLLLDLNAKESAGLLRSFRNAQPQRTTTEFAEVYDFESVGWDEEQREIFLRICSGPMERYGYTTGKEYGASVSQATV